MANTTADARHEVDDARAAAAAELDRLGPAAKATLDVPARLRRDPVRTSAVAGGAAFLLLGGPKRLLKAAEHRLLPRRRPRSLLPKEVEQTLRNLPEEQRTEVEAHLERDFATYLAREHAKEQPNARRSLWGTYDTVMGIVGATAARELLKKFMTTGSAAETENRRREQGGEGGGVG